VSRTLFAPHQAAPSGTSADYLAIWRCDEAAAASNFTDALAVRTLTQVGSPVPVLSPFRDEGAASGLGARDFNGSTQYATQAAPSADNLVVQTLRFGAALWLQRDVTSLRVLLELGDILDGTSASNLQGSLFITAAGALSLQWQTGNNSNRSVVTANNLIALGATHNVGFSYAPDPARHDKVRVRLYVDGACVLDADNLDPPSGGSDARWIVGASWANSAGPGPALFHDGRIDDVVLCRFTPSHEWFRWVYARGVCDFLQRADEIGNQVAGSRVFETYMRVLVEVGPAGLSNGVVPPMVNQSDVDLTNLFDVDFLLGAKWREHVDDADAGATIQLAPRHGFFNLSPFAEGPLAPLFGERRRIKIETAVVPCGTTRDGVGPFWQLRFDGWVLQVSPGGTELELLAAGKGAPLLSAWVEPSKTGGDRQYGSALGQPLETAMQTIIDEMDPARFEVLRIDDNGPANAFNIDVHGVSVEHGEGRPHPFVAGDIVKVEGAVNAAYNGLRTLDAATTSFTLRTVEVGTGALAPETVGTVRGVEALSYKGGKPTLWCPVSPGFNIFPRNEPASKSVGALLDDWAEEIGWRCQFRWHDLRQEFRLKLHDARSAGGSVTRTADQVMEPEGLMLNHDDQRTVGAVEYASDADKDAAGERRRYVETARNTTAMRADGRYYFRLAAGPASMITSAAEGAELVLTMLADMPETAEARLRMPYDPAPETHDEIILPLTTAGVLSSSLQTISVAGAVTYYAAIAGVEHEFSINRIRTTLELKRLGKVPLSGVTIARARRHLERLNARGSAAGIGLSPLPTPAAPTLVNLGAVSVARVIFVRWPYPTSDLKRAYRAAEIHVSSTNNFTPSSATLEAIAEGSQKAITHSIAAGTTGYVKIRFRDDLGNVSAASPQTSFTS
jgi:hypothetical protein